MRQLQVYVASIHILAIGTFMGIAGGGMHDFVLIKLIIIIVINIIESLFLLFSVSAYDSVYNNLSA